MAILKKAKVATAHDGGKELLKTFSEYDGLADAVKSLHIEVDVLTKQADGLQEKAKIKGETESKISKLNSEKASLEGYVAGLQSQKDEMDQLTSEVNSLKYDKANLDDEINKLEEARHSMDDDIKSKEAKVSNLTELESKHEGLLQKVAETDAKVKGAEKEWQIFEAFLGSVQSSSLPELEKFIKALPGLLEEVKQGKYSPELLKTYLLRQLAGPALQLLKCKNCQAKFTVDKPPKYDSYECPVCGFSSEVVVDQDMLDMLKAELPALRQERPIVVGGITLVMVHNPTDPPKA